MVLNLTDVSGVGLWDWEGKGNTYFIHLNPIYTYLKINKKSVIMDF